MLPEGFPFHQFRALLRICLCGEGLPLRI